MVGDSPNVSISDVAVRAGVSTATVSRTLRGLPNVSEDTRRRVMRAATDLSYVVSPMASRLASGRTNTVALLVPYASRWYFGQVIAGAESVLHESELDLLLYNLGDPVARERFFARQPLRRRVDGVLDVSMQLTEAEQESLRSLAVPVVVIGADVAASAGCVRIDDAGAVADGVRYLIELGHRRIGMISTYADQNMWLPVAHERRRGYLAALAEAGLPADDELVVSVPFGIGSAERAMNRLLALDPPPTAVYCESDELAFGALAALRRAEIPVPARMSVMGFDDHDLAAPLDLTTIRQPVLEQGALAARMLTRALADPDAGPGIQTVATTLVVRGSTAPPR